jgi:UDP-3-O-[3-hydroxymyristoyl] glucosamine N-acyltransferase
LVTNSISDNAKIGENVKIWHFAYVGENVVIGDNVKIGSLAHIDYDVKIGENTMIEGLVYKKCFHWSSSCFNK